MPVSTKKKVVKESADEAGHFIKNDPSHFRSKVGKSDIIKKGEHDPFAYIKLNPKMLNK